MSFSQKFFWPKRVYRKENDSFSFLSLPILKQNKPFLNLILICFTIAAIIHPYPKIAMWFGFFLAGYSAISNDSIQTIGTFLSSNRHRKWWILWIFIGGVFFITTLYSWIVYGGDVSHQRLLAKGFEKAPESFKFLNIAAPIFLLILTRLKMPVSTTFLLLSSFAATGNAIGKVMFKSLSGYLLAFIIAIIVFIISSKLIEKVLKNNPHPIWHIIQWITTGTLWSIWIQQDAANIAVFLPRSLSIMEFIIFSLFIVGGLGVLLYYKGGKIQSIVNEKSVIHDVRSATIIDFIYAIILFYFKLYSNVPMSTTWVFLGLLAGREVGMTLLKTATRNFVGTVKLLSKDIVFACLGLFVSISIAISVNPDLKIKDIGSSFKNQSIKFIQKLF